MTTTGRLRRCFPGPVVMIGLDRVADHKFLESLTESLVKLDAETPTEVLPTVKKADSIVEEYSDTVHPKFVTEMLTGILRAIGRPCDVSRIYKHTRDDVLWKNTGLPWRRSPLWLLLRVALQTSLMRDEAEKPHLQYKSFMLFFMARILNLGLKASLSSGTLFVMTAKIIRRVLKLDTVDGTPGRGRHSEYCGAKVELQMGLVGETLRDPAQLGAIAAVISFGYQIEASKAATLPRKSDGAAGSIAH
jgi:hypothetical protein